MSNQITNKQLGIGNKSCSHKVIYKTYNSNSEYYLELNKVNFPETIIRNTARCFHDPDNIISLVNINNSVLNLFEDDLFLSYNNDTWVTIKSHVIVRIIMSDSNLIRVEFTFDNNITLEELIDHIRIYKCMLSDIPIDNIISKLGILSKIVDIRSFIELI